jgi:hypothetical protein
MIHLKQNDQKPAAATVLSDGTNPIDLTNATSVTFKMREMGSSTLKVDAAAVITDAVNGECEYRWVSGDTDSSGTYWAEWQVLWNDGDVQTFPTISQDVVIIHGDLDS